MASETSKIDKEEQGEKISRPEVRWQFLMEAAVAGKNGAPFPEGKLSRATLSTRADGSKSHTWHYEIKESSTTIGIEVCTAVIDPRGEYEAIKKEFATASDEGWKEWPRGFPNQNDYEGVEICGTARDGKRAAWVQGRSLIALKVESGGGDVLWEVSDGVWGVVYTGAGQ